jgi:opacity protein-like surface antigen
MHTGGLFLRHTHIFCAAFAAAAAIMLPRPALAEFQIQEASIEKGETEFEYRGAYHWGVPEATEENENANDLVQSHEFELQYSFTNWWLLQVTVGLEQPLHEDLEASSVEFEPEFALIKRKGDGIALSFQGGYAKSTNGEADTFGFGPIVEVAKKNLLITLNPLFTGQVGPNRETDGLGFEYGWRAEYDFAKHWGVGVEMFGEIEDLSHAGSFNQQNHSIGPTLFWSPTNKEEDVGDAAGGDEDENKTQGPAPLELSFNVGVQFGLTDATSDTALKFQGSLSF